MSRRLLALLLCLVIVFTVSGCGAAPGAESKSAGRTVTDGAGRELSLPEDGAAEKIASVYGTAVPFIVAAGVSDQVVAINCKSNFWKKAVEPLNAAGTVGKGVVDLEALAASGATVLIHRSNDMKTVEAVDKLGIQTLCITAEDMDGIYSTLRLIGEYFGKTERAQEVIGWMNGKFEKIDEIVSAVPESQRPTALVLGGEKGRVAGNDMIQSWMVEKAGGICVADVGEDHNWITVGEETVLGWNPEYMFCTSSASLDYTVDELMEDPAWSAMQCVLDEHIAVIPSKLDTWDMPGIAIVPGTFWMLHQMYPELFSAEELQAEIDEYYTFMFGQNFDAEYLGYVIE